MIDERMKRGKKRERQRVEKVMRGERERIPDLSGGQIKERNRKKRRSIRGSEKPEKV